MIDLKLKKYINKANYDCILIFKITYEKKSSLYGSTNKVMTLFYL